MNTINKSIKEALFRAYNTRNRNNKNQKRFDVIFGTIFFFVSHFDYSCIWLDGSERKSRSYHAPCNFFMLWSSCYICFAKEKTYYEAAVFGACGSGKYRKDRC